jgi:hypothetical protein
VNSGGTTFNCNGGSGQFAYNANNWLGMVGDLGGYYTGNGFSGGIFPTCLGRGLIFAGTGRSRLLRRFYLGAFGAATVRR